MAKTDDDHDDRFDVENDTIEAGPGGDGPSDIEARARRHGWIPEEEWDAARAEKEGRRKPKFVSAEEFLDRVENDMPIMRERLERNTQVIGNLEHKLAESTKKIDEMTSIFKTQQEWHKDALKRAREQGRAEAEAQMRAAVEDGDPTKYDTAKAKLDEIIEEERKLDTTGAGGADEDEPPPKKPNRDPAIAAWQAENPWFDADLTLNHYMVEREAAVAMEQPGLAMSDRLAKAKRQVMAKFPEKFGINPRRNGAPAADMPSGDRGGGGSSSIEAIFSRLPKADKDIYERHRRMIEERSGGKEKYTHKDFVIEGGYAAGAET
jgi:cell division septum initiation protein DivIVA